jgi:polysaccharide export outer membrane protein
LRDDAGPIVEIQNPPPPASVRYSSSAYQTGVAPASHSAASPGGGSAKVNLLEVSQSPDSIVHQPLFDGAIVTVEELPERTVTVTGITRNTILPLPANREMRLLDALALARGTPYSEWIVDRVTVVRRVPGSDKPVIIKGSIRKAKTDNRENIVLADGDIFSVDETPLTFTLSTLGKLIGVGRSVAAVP